jgi:hypothetical protein
MIQRLNPSDYYTGPYGRGTHCVVLVLADDMLPAVASPFRRVAEQFRTVTFWVCGIESTDDAEAVQAIRFPQYRFIRDGTERYCHTGLLEDNELACCFDKLEDPCTPY